MLKIFQLYTGTIISDTDLSSKLVCRLLMSFTLFMSLSVSSGYNLLVLSIERYLAITQVLTYDEERIRTKLWFVFPLVWISGFIATLPDQMFYTVKNRICYFEVYIWSVRDTLFLYSFYLCVNFLIPGIMMVVLHIKMGISILRSQRQRKQMTLRDIQQDKLVDAHKNIFKTCILLVGLYCSCWIVNGIHMMLYLSKVVPYSAETFHMCAILLVLNSVVNPFIYTIKYDEFQKHFKLLIFNPKT